MKEVYTLDDLASRSSLDEASGHLARLAVLPRVVPVVAQLRDPLEVLHVAHARLAHRLRRVARVHVDDDERGERLALELRELAAHEQEAVAQPHRAGRREAERGDRRERRVGRGRVALARRARGEAEEEDTLITLNFGLELESERAFTN